MDPTLHPSPAAWHRAQRQSRAEMRRAYREANPPAPLGVYLWVGLFGAAVTYGIYKFRTAETGDE